MKISLNSVKSFNQEYITTKDVTAIGVDELIEKIGSQLGAVEEVENIGDKYKGIIIAKVVSCDPHPDADSLSLCFIDDGGAAKDVERNHDDFVQVVCGAPNVKAGQTVAWLPPGSTVPETVGKEPFVLEARAIRGKKSNGMLASPKELALGDSHEGILVINEDIKPGKDFAEVFGLKDDVVIDIENKMFTHRPDCFGLLGVSRELAGIQQMPFKSPDWYVTNPAFPAIETDKLPLIFANELPNLVPRFSAIVMSDVTVGPSSARTQIELAKIGQKSINNIVDYTNLFMLLTGQPLHAYDYDKVKALSSHHGATIMVRKPHKGEKIKLLNGKEIEPRADAIMIATDKQAIGIGGVMGGSETEVDEKTTNIILECASFDMYSVRRTSMAHGLFTDAVTRFNKGQSPLQNLAVLAKIVQEIRASGFGRVAGKVIDDSHLERGMIDRQSVHPKVSVTAQFINERLGLDLSIIEIRKLLQIVEFDLQSLKDDSKAAPLEILAPFWRTDIEIAEDIVEEVGRLYGYDHLPLVLPKRDLSPIDKDPILTLKADIRERLAAAGANEVLTYSFVHGDLLDKTGQDRGKAFQLSNALSPDLQYYRVSLMPSLLDKVHANIKAGYDQFTLFELGKTHSLDHINDGLPGEFEFTALVVAANDKLKKSGAAYYEARKYLEELAGEDDLEYKPISPEMMQYPVVQPYNPDRSALVSYKGGDFLGIVGEFKPSVARALKLPKYCAGFELDTSVLHNSFAAGPSYTPLSRFPGVKQDITLKVAANRPYAEVEDFVNTELGANAPDETHIALEPTDIYQKETDSKQYTFRITVTGQNRTLTDKEVTGVLDAIAGAAHDKLDAERI